MARERYMGVSVERTLRELLRRELQNEAEALELAERILDVFIVEGRRGVKRLIEELSEGEARGSAPQAVRG